MKIVTSIASCFLLIFAANVSSAKGGGHAGSHASHSSRAAAHSSSHAHYPNQGGHYVGGQGSSHKGGHYVNSRTGNHAWAFGNAKWNTKRFINARALSLPPIQRSIVRLAINCASCN